MLPKMFDIKGLFIWVPLYTVGVLLLGASVTYGLFVFHVAVLPLIFKYSKTFRRTLLFANFVQWPLNIDYGELSASGIEGGRNLSLQYYSKVDNCTIKIGIWHILPKSVYERLKGEFEGNVNRDELNRKLDEELANSKTPIMMYCHGIWSSRAAPYKTQLYKFFQLMDFHTITFDYRGYGDSTKINPSEDGVVEDSLVVYEWIHNTIEKSNEKPPVFVWGHSLGTGISSHLLGNLEELSTTVLERRDPLPLPKGLILEAPFNNLADEVANHPLSKLVTWLPYYESTFVSPFRLGREHTFRSDRHLARATALPVLILHAQDDVIVPYVVGLKVRAFVSPFRLGREHTFRSDRHLARATGLPVLILHAQDDVIVPYNVGLKLYNSILESRAQGGATVKLHKYDKSENLGHKWICMASDLHEVIGEFVKNHR